MSVPVCYVACPVGALPEEIDKELAEDEESDHAFAGYLSGEPDGARRSAARAVVKGNLARARRWLAALIANVPDVAWCMPWLPYLSVLEETPANRERGLRDDCAIAARCDGIVLVGGRVSSGMEREEMAVRYAGGWSLDATYFGKEPPNTGAPIWADLRALIDVRVKAGRP
jgi:hypothetical protein